MRAHRGGPRLADVRRSLRDAAKAVRNAVVVAEITEAARIRIDSPRLADGKVDLPFFLEVRGASPVKVIGVRVDRNDRVGQENREWENLPRELEPRQRVPLIIESVPWRRWPPSTIFVEVRLDILGRRQGGWLWVELNRRPLTGVEKPRVRDWEKGSWGSR